jgi:hypothetical protein
MSDGLGRKVPPTFAHVERFPLRVPALAALMPPVEKVLKLPYLAQGPKHDQGIEGACVGFGMSLMLAILNSYQSGDLHWYNQRWLWDRAKERDWWPDTNPGDSNGTSLDAAQNVLRTLGHVRIKRGRMGQPDASQGIKENRWARSVDEMRAVIGVGVPVAIGVNWYAAFDDPVLRMEGLRQSWWLPEGYFGPIRGGHCVCVYGASDRRQAFRVANSWGKSYPLTWLPYSTMQQLIDEDGEVALVTDL